MIRYDSNNCKDNHVHDEVLIEHRVLELSSTKGHEFVHDMRRVSARVLFKTVLRVPYMYKISRLNISRFTYCDPERVDTFLRALRYVHENHTNFL